MVISIICPSRGRYGVFTPAVGFSGGRLKCRSFTYIIGKSAASASPAAVMALHQHPNDQFIIQHVVAMRIQSDAHTPV
jgi:hypothetical protein